MGTKSNVRATIRLILISSFVVYFVLAAGCGTLVHHKVKKGDSLYAIGFYYGQDYRDIAQWNEISSPYVLYAGQWLRVAPPEIDWRKGYKKNEKYDPIKPEKNKNTRVVTTRYPTKFRPVQVEDFTDKASPVRAWLWPSRGRLLNSNKAFPVRKGINIAGKRGQPIRATAAGKVVYSGNGLIGYGKLLIIKHNKMYLSAYAHNDAMLVKEGDMVKQGQQIAKMGLTPDQRTLLHFEIRKNGKPVDPLSLLARKN